MNRKASAFIVPILLMISAQSAGAAPTQAQAGERPNVLVILGDNWSTHAGALGDRTVKTPTFDRIAREGVLLNQVYCPVPSCSPTRSAVLTGRPAHQLEEAANLWSIFPRKFRVFTHAVRDGGYSIGFTGKGWGPGKYRELGWTENPVGPEFKDLTEFLERRDPSKPFLFWLGDQHTARGRWQFDADSGLDQASIVVPPELPDVPEVRRAMMAYYDGVQRLDAAAAKAVKLLEEQGVLDDTVVIYTSDNGWQLPRGLGNCYDTGCRVPMAVRWAGRFRAGRTVDDFVNLIDLGPTIMELAGVEKYPEMTGRSFADLLRGQRSAHPRDAVFLERERHANVRRGDLGYPIRAIRTNQYLYIWNLRPDRWPAGDPVAYYSVGDYGDVDGSPAKSYILENAAKPDVRPYFDLAFAKRPAEELYDLKADPAQMNNVANAPGYATIRDNLRHRVERWMHETSDPRVDPAYDKFDEYKYMNEKKTAFDRQ